MAGRMGLDKAKEMAGAINLLVNHQLPTQAQIDGSLAELGQKFPELVVAGEVVKQECDLTEEKRLVDDQVLGMIAAGKLDEALAMVDGWKKSGA